MASMTQAAAAAERAIGHGDNAITAQDVTNPGRNREKYGDPTENMKALVWQGKNKVEVITCPKPSFVARLGRRDGEGRYPRPRVLWYN
jgi:hypothetical protein